MTDRAPTARFSDRAGAYSVHRPGYPDAVFDALFEGLGEPRALVVADVGAGTGISTTLLAERAAKVIAVEPNASMRERAAPAANVQWTGGTAEQTGLPDNSVDVAAAFQAFHWFDPAVAFEEFARIARRRVALVQYERDETHPFSAAYTATIRPFMLDETERLRMQTLEAFANLAGEKLRRAVVPASQTLTLDGVLGRIASSSYLPKTGERA
ncbi:MAG: class I SAM-dependent methyltransferase, partial [Candidatus Eremiobacteraeota bacterium]|nr:class I SAM-dependent methyltransferase [Candidatus Eremiobacteraeota bacterium]MBV8355483.1 class I SAM-dependent methyltransferase [Candidatus Eremiobacteraeota bacterium]